MKTTIKKTFIFLLNTLIAAILIALLFLFATSAKSKSFSIDDTITEVFLGDSHMRYAVNDSLLPHSINLGNSSESVYFSYYKLKQLLKSNQSIETVYLGFSYHNISDYYDQYINGQYALSVSPNYFYILPLTEQFQMIIWNIQRLPSFVMAVLKSGVKVWRNQNTYEGGFDNPHTNTTANKATMDERLNSQYYSNITLNSFSTLNLKYFDNIVDFCKEKQVELVIVNTPMQTYYQSKVPQNYIDKYLSIIKTNNLRIIDLSLLVLPDTSFKGEGDLVSMEGAMRGTEEIKMIVE